MISAIILAAGRSRRMGRQKVLLPYAGATVIERIVAVLQKGTVDEIIVVVGHDADRVVSVLKHVGVHVVHNKSNATGMLSSVRCGILAASPSTTGFMIALGDQPSIRPDVVASLISTFENPSPSTDAILVPTFQGHRGHPVVFAAQYREAILSRFDGVGLRGLLHAYAEQVRTIPVGHSDILRDMDGPEDYARELDRLARDEVEGSGGA